MGFREAERIKFDFISWRQTILTPNNKPALESLYSIQIKLDRHYPSSSASG